ncbi:hypothetical protein ISP15_10730 [Dyella jejuensis]|uniref:DUF3301 domain-containing protein n=1 Tax=Dyella jejuensis TaxID=1432009 RepID=A0ABW8JII8_9GAMM
MHPYAHLLIVLMLLATGLSIYWQIRRVRTMLHAWADSNGYTLLEHGRFWAHTPSLGMLLTTSRNQTLVYVKVYDSSTHRIRSGWLRLGSYWLGVLDADAIEMQWDA